MKNGRRGYDESSVHHDSAVVVRKRRGKQTRRTLAAWDRLEKELRQRLAQNVRLLREEEGLSQEEAAASCRMPSRTWQRIEAGDTNTALRLLTIAQVCVALNVPPAKLFE